MTFLEAAIEVLRHEPEPLHFAEIAKRAVQRNLLSHVGRDPEAAMRTCLNSAVRGDQAILTRNKPGYYALTPGIELPPPAAAPAPVAPVVAPVAAAVVKNTSDVVAVTVVRETVAAAVPEAPEGPEGPEGPDVGVEEASEPEEEGGEDGGGREGGRRKRRRNRFGVRGEAPPPQLVAVKPSRRGADVSKRSEVLQKVHQLEFEAPRGAGLDGVTDVALVMANAMSRLAEERPELRSEFESMQRGPSTNSGPAPEVRNMPRRMPPRAGSGGPPERGNGGNANSNNSANSNGNSSHGTSGGLDEDERGGRRRRRRRKRGRRVEWTNEGGGDSRAGGEMQAQGLLSQVAAVLAEAGPRSLHIRQIAENLAGQNVLGGEISEIERAVTAGVLLDIRKLGRASRFVARGDARYQLQTSRLPGPAAAAEQSLRVAADLLDGETTNQLVQWLQVLGPRSLEALARIYLEREGFSLVTTLPPVRGVGKLVVQDPEAEDEDGRVLVLVLPRKAGLDASNWAGDSERNSCSGHLVFAMGEAPDLAEQRTVGPHEFARWLRTQGIGVTTLAIEVTVLDPTVIESIGGLDT